MPSEKDNLRRALGRLGRVPPDVLSLSRQRIRGNLNVDLRLTAPLPLPDARPADLTVLRRPFYIGGAMALVCLFVIVGALVLWRPEKRSASTLGAKSASMQTSKPQSPVPAPRSGVAAPPSVTTDFPKPGKTPPSRAATRSQSSSSTPVEARRPQPRPTLLPPGEGRVILDRACDACHRAAAVGFYHYATRAEYAEVVSRMIAMGAPVSEQDAAVLTDYLFNNLVAKTAPEVERQGPQ